MFLREIYCNYESATISKWSDTELTQCPNNVAHSVQAGSETIVEVARLTHNLKDSFSTSSGSYTTVTRFVYQGTNFYDIDAISPKYLKVRASVNTGSYNLKLSNGAGTQLYVSGNLTNTTIQTTTIDFGTFTNDANESLYLLEVKCNSGATCNVFNVAIYGSFVPE
jgi:hypothetical protein